MKRAIVIGLVMAMLFSTEAYGAGLNRGKNQPAVIVAADAAEEPEAAQGQTAEEKSKDLTAEEKSKDLTAEEKSRDLTEDFRCR